VVSRPGVNIPNQAGISNVEEVPNPAFSPDFDVGTTSGSRFMILQADRVSRVESSGGRACNALPVRANH